MFILPSLLEIFHYVWMNINGDRYVSQSSTRAYIFNESYVWLNHETWLLQQQF